MLAKLSMIRSPLNRDHFRFHYEGIESPLRKNPRAPGMMCLCFF